MESQFSSSKAKWSKKQEQYENAKQARIEKVDLLKTVTMECNDLIGIENEALNESQAMESEFIAEEQKLEVIRYSISDCVKTISLYAAFKEQNQRNIGMINSHYSAQWDSFESNCYNWTTHQLIVWFRKNGISIDTESNGPNLLSDNVEEHSLVHISPLFHLRWFNFAITITFSQSMNRTRTGRRWRRN